jgi:hypothetical protein
VRVLALVRVVSVEVQVPMVSYSVKLTFCGASLRPGL